jgi:hypothetical protein
MNFPAFECDRFDDLGDAVSLGFTRDEKNERSDQQTAERWYPKDPVPRQIGKCVQGGTGCPNRQPLDKIDQLSKDNSATASDDTDSTGKGDQRKRLYPLKLLTQPLTGRRGEEQRMSLLFCGYRGPGTGFGLQVSGYRRGTGVYVPLNPEPRTLSPVSRVSLPMGFWAVKSRTVLALTFHRKTLR